MQILAELPNKRFHLTEERQSSVLHSLFDIMLAYAYDFRLNEGQTSPESAWDINKLSPTLCWFQVHRNIWEAAASFMRRSLSYPLLRHWILNLKILEDAIKIFSLGRRQLLNCLVSIYEIFEADDSRKILNTLYIEDYLIWVQQIDPVVIKNYVDLAKSCRKIRKQDVLSILPDIEREAVQILKENENDYKTWRRNISDLMEIANDKKITNFSISEYYNEESDDDSSDASTSS